MTRNRRRPARDAHARQSAPLRLALVGPYRYRVREPFAGGLESHVSQLAAGLRSRGHHVALFARRGSTGVLPGDELDDDWMPSPAAQVDVSMPSLASILEHHAYQRLMLRLIHGEGARRFDVIHLHAVHHLPVALAPSIPLPVLATLHTPPTPWLESALVATQGTGVTFTAVSAHVANAWTVLAERPAVVLNGVDTGVWCPGPGGRDLVWSGRIVPEKAPHLAIQAARAASRRIVLAGPMPDRAYAQREIMPLLGGDVVYAGHLRQRELAALVGRAAAVLATPVWEEPFGLIVGEALACGTPVVAFDRGGIRQVIGSAGNGILVPPGDTDAMAAAVTEVERLDRDAIRADALARLSLDRMVSSYVRHYRRLVAAEHDPAVSRYVTGSQALQLEGAQPALHREPAPAVAELVGISDD